MKYAWSKYVLFFIYFQILQSHQVFEVWVWFFIYLFIHKCWRLGTVPLTEIVHCYFCHFYLVWVSNLPHQTKSWCVSLPAAHNESKLTFLTSFLQFFINWGLKIKTHLMNVCMYCDYVSLSAIPVCVLWWNDL